MEARSPRWSDSTRRQLESAWRRFLALDSTSANGATPPFWGRDTHFLWGLLLRPISVISPALFLGEKNAFGEGNFDGFGGEKINGNKKGARRTGRVG